MEQQSQEPMPQQQYTQQPPVSEQYRQPYTPPAPEIDDEESSGSGKRIFMGILGLIVIIVIAAGSYYLGTQRSSSNVSVSKKTVAVTPTTVPSPTPDITVNWSTYTNAKYMYSIKYPSTVTPKENTTYYYYVTFEGQKGALPPYVVSVIPDTFVVKDLAAYNLMSSDYIDELYALKPGETKTTTTGTVLTKLPDTTVDGQPAIFIGVNATGFKQHRVYVKKNNNIYMISDYYQGPEDLKGFTTFLSTFKFN